MTWRNLTPHALRIERVRDGEFFTPDPDPAGPARVDQSVVLDHATDCGMPVYRRVMGEVTGLPDPEPNVSLIVSALVATHPSVAGRADVFSPGELIRDAAGKPIGCRGLFAA